MLDVRARRRRDRRQRLSQPRKLPIHYATLGALAGAILGFMLYLTVPVAMGVERFIAMTPIMGERALCRDRHPERYRGAVGRGLHLEGAASGMI